MHIKDWGGHYEVTQWNWIVHYDASVLWAPLCWFFQARKCLTAKLAKTKTSAKDTLVGQSEV